MDAMNHQRPNVHSEDQRHHGWTEELAAPPSLATDILERLEAEQPADKHALRDALHHPDWTVRTAAVQALGRLQDPLLLEPLQNALQDEHVSVRAASIYALGQPAFNAPLALFAHALQDQDWQVREKAVLALTRQGTAEALKLVQGVLYDPNAAVRDMAFYALQEAQMSQSVPSLSSLKREADEAPAPLSSSSFHNPFKAFYYHFSFIVKRQKRQKQPQGAIQMSKIPEIHDITQMEPLPVHSQRPRWRRFTTTFALAIVVVLVVVWAIVLQFHVLPGANPATRPTATPVSTKTATHQTPTATPTFAVPPRTTANIIYTYNSPSRDVFSVAWSPDDTRLLMAEVNAVKSLDATTGLHVVTYPNQIDGGATAVSWSPNGNFIAGAGTTIELWNAGSGQSLGTFTPPLQTGKTATLYQDFVNVAWSPDSTLLAVSVLGTDYKDGLYIWNPQTRQIVSSIPATFDNPFGNPKWSPDGKYIAIETNQKIQVYSIAKKTFVSEHSGMTFAWSPDSTKLAVVDDSLSSLFVEDAFSNKQLSRSQYRSLTEGYSGISTIDWSLDGAYIAFPVFTYQAVAIVDVATGKIVLRDTKQVWNGGNGVQSVAWSHNSKMIATASGGETGPASVQVWTPS